MKQVRGDKLRNISLGNLTLLCLSRNIFDTASINGGKKRVAEILQ